MPVSTIIESLARGQRISKRGVVFHGPALLNIRQATRERDINDIQLPQYNIRRVLVKRH